MTKIHFLVNSVSKLALSNHSENRIKIRKYIEIKVPNTGFSKAKQFQSS